MNLLYCGDEKITDGLVISILSLCSKVREPLDITVLTMSLKSETKEYDPVRPEMICFLDSYLKEKNPENSVRCIDVSDLFAKMPPTENMDTRFTPCCMLRLYADLVPEIPDRILYLDNDVVCRRDCSNFYHQDMKGYELAGCLDYYGKWFFRRRLLHRDYLNSGVLLLNMQEIRQTGLFKKCRRMCRQKKMFMPDQSAINKLAVAKKICSGKYNEQKKLRKDTVIQHFTTTFRFFPWVHTVTIKPWQIGKLHTELGITEYDDILREYQEFMISMRRAVEGVDSGNVTGWQITNSRD